MTDVIIIGLQLTLLALTPFKDKIIALHVRDLYRAYGRDVAKTIASFSKAVFFKVVSLFNKASSLILGLRKKETLVEAEKKKATIRIMSMANGTRKFFRRRG